MPEVIQDPALWASAAFVLVLATIVGVFRRDPWWITALTVASWLVFVIGFRWVGTFGSEAGFAAMLMSVGSVLMLYGQDWARRRRERSRPAGS